MHEEQTYGNKNGENSITHTKNLAYFGTYTKIGFAKVSEHLPNQRSRPLAVNAEFRKVKFECGVLTTAQFS